MKTENLVKLNKRQFQQLVKGELSFIEHPDKGTCKVYTKNIYIIFS